MLLIISRLYLYKFSFSVLNGTLWDEKPPKQLPELDRNV